MSRRITLILFIGVFAWWYNAFLPPHPSTCGSPGGPLVTAPRIKLKDGRYLAYEEYGVQKESAKHSIVFIHPFGSCRHDAVIATQVAPEFLEQLGVYIVSFDRPGYGESDPNPKRTVERLVLDVEELADQLELGPKFYVVGFSMGAQAAWGCLKYIPHRLAGAALLAPVVNYWWSGFPANLSTEAYYQQPLQDQWALIVAHYAPWLTYWWNTQKWFPASSALRGNPAIFSTQDIRLLPNLIASYKNEAQRKQQGEFESVHRDMIVGFGNWKFDPMDLENPFPNQGSVHLWQGDDDRLVPVMLQQYISRRLPWIHYHELPGAGHIFPYAEGMSERILKALILGDI